MSPLDARLATIPALAGRIYGAARLSSLIGSNGLAQVCPAAFVLPLGVAGGRVDAVTGLYRQEIEWLEGVLLVVRAAGDATGAAGLQQLDPLIADVIAAVAGWAPGNAVDGTYRLAKGELAGLDKGTLTYQLDFAIEDQLRIVRQ